MIRAIVATLVLLSAPATAQESAVADAQGSSPGLSVELNAVADAEAGGCTMSFLIENRHEAAIERAVYETVLFDGNGQVARLTLFDFGALPPGRPRVRQFTLEGPSCDGYSRILFNGANDCQAGALGESACTDGLDLGSRTAIEVIG